MVEAPSFNAFVGEILSNTPRPKNAREYEYRDTKVIDLRGLSDNEKNGYIDRYKDTVTQHAQVSDYNELHKNLTTQQITFSS